jgi:hypothetical protein
MQRQCGPKACLEVALDRSQRSSTRLSRDSLASRLVIQQGLVR